jgi:hypothetical protein
LAFDELGHGQESLPFDYMCTRIEGIIGFLTNDFKGFFDFTNIVSFEVGPTPLTVYRNTEHSWWHDDPTDPACREKFARRIERMKGIQAYDTPVLFVRVAATTDELPKADTLQHILAETFGPQAKLLLIVAGQLPNASALGPRLIDGMPNILVYLTPMCNCAEGISAGLKWNSGELPKCKRSTSLTSIEGLHPAHTGYFGMGGMPAFENIPDHIPRPRLAAVNVRSTPKLPDEHDLQEEDDDKDDRDEDDRDEDDLDDEMPDMESFQIGMQSFCGVARQHMLPQKGLGSKKTSAGAGGFLSIVSSLFPACGTEGFADEGSEDGEEFVVAEKKY